MMYGVVQIFKFYLTSLSLLLLCMFPDPTLTPKNLSTVLNEMDDGMCALFSEYVNIPQSESQKIVEEYSSDRELKQALIPHLINTHPALSWKLVANALYQMVYGNTSCHRALDHLQQQFPTSYSTVVARYSMNVHREWVPIYRARENSHFIFSIH